MSDSIEQIENISAADVRPDMEVPRYAPSADLVAQGGESSPLHPRTARLIDAQRNAGVTEVRAIPRREMLHREAMIEAAGPRAGDMDPIPYLIGNIDGIEI